MSPHVVKELTRMSWKGRLFTLIERCDQNDRSLGLEGYSWHAHPDSLAAIKGIAEAEATDQFVRDLLEGKLWLTLLWRGADLEDAWLTEEPAHDLRFVALGESLEFVRWQTQSSHQSVPTTPAQEPKSPS